MAIGAHSPMQTQRLDFVSSENLDTLGCIGLQQQIEESKDLFDNVLPLDIRAIEEPNGSGALRQRSARLSSLLGKDDDQTFHHEFNARTIQAFKKNQQDLEGGILVLFFFEMIQDDLDVSLIGALCFRFRVRKKELVRQEQFRSVMEESRVSDCPRHQFARFRRCGERFLTE